MVRARSGLYKTRPLTTLILHTYLDGTRLFMSQVRGPWRPFIARRPCPQRVSAVCMGFGSCTVSIFSCPIMATLARWAFIFCWLGVLTLTLLYKHRKRIAYRWHHDSIRCTDCSSYFCLYLCPVWNTTLIGSTIRRPRDAEIRVSPISSLALAFFAENLIVS